MKKLIIVLFLISLFSGNLFAYKYAFDSIPEPLKKNANAVIRTNEMVFRMYNQRRATIHYKYAVTVINENADYLRSFRIFYNSFRSVSAIKASIYDNNGKLIERIPSVNIMDSEAISGFFSDERVKKINFPVNKYPYTIEVEYQVSVNSFMNLPIWNFQTSSDIAVQRSGVQYIIPKDIKFRYKEFYLNNSVDSMSLDNSNVYTWVEHNIPAMKKWFFMPYSMTHRPRLLAGVDSFIFSGRPGTMESWNSLGQWFYELNEGLDVLPESEVASVIRMTQGVADDREKARILYNYMQSKTRYVSIQLGIGGFKPFPASYVSERGYGDCKALTNYMYSLLKVAGIKSYYTLVASGDNRDIVTSFVSDQFDHIILCVPVKKDTVWLECTNQTMPFNFLGSFTANRSVLLLTPEGGVLAKTPKIENNTVYTTASFDIKKYNESEGTVTQTNYGAFYDESLKYNNKSEDEIKRYLNMELPMGTFTVPSVTFTTSNIENPSSELKYALKVKGFAVPVKGRFYFYPCINKMDYLPKDSSALKIYETTTMVDSIVYHIPSGQDLDFLPEDINLEANSGSFFRTIRVGDDGTIVFIRRLTLRRGIYSGEDADELYDFVRVVARADHQKIIIRLHGA